MLRLPNLGLILVVGLLSVLPVYGQQNELRSLANNLAQDIAAAGKKTIAVVDFVDLQGNTSELGRFLAEEFSVAMVRAHKGFEVVERNHINAILAEHKLSASGLIDPATAKQLGQFSGADAIVTGSMTPFAEHVHVAVKVLSTDSARIIAADDTDLAKTQTITDLIGNANQKGGGSGPDTRTMGLPGGGRSSSTIPTGRPVAFDNEVKYELIDCKGVGDSVRCSFQITNNGPDKNIVYFCGRTYPMSPSTAFDNLGNKSSDSSCSIANHTISPVSYTVTLVSGVTANGSMLFSGLSPDASSLSLISIKAQERDRVFEVSFRKVLIVR